MNPYGLDKERGDSIYSAWYIRTLLRTTPIISIGNAHFIAH